MVSCTAEAVAAEAKSRMEPLKKERRRLLNDLIVAKGMTCVASVLVIVLASAILLGLYYRHLNMQERKRLLSSRCSITARHSQKPNDQLLGNHDRMNPLVHHSSQNITKSNHGDSRKSPNMDGSIIMIATFDGPKVWDPSTMTWPISVAV